MPFGWLSRKSSAIPPKKPASAPAAGPSSDATTIVSRAISSGFAPPNWNLAKTTDCRSRAVTTSAIHRMTRRIARVYGSRPERASERARTQATARHGVGDPEAEGAGWGDGDGDGAT